MPEKAFLSEQLHKTQELKTDLKPIEKAYLDRLVTSVNQVLAGRTIEQMVEQKDVASLEKYLDLTRQIKMLITEKMIDEFEGVKPRILSMAEVSTSEKKNFSVAEIKSLIKNMENLQDNEIKVKEIWLREDGKLVMVNFLTTNQEADWVGEIFDIDYKFLVSGSYEKHQVRFTSINKNSRRPKQAGITYVKEKAKFKNGEWVLE